MKKRLVIGLSGASGAPLGIELLRGMQYFPDWETHLVYSSSTFGVLQQFCKDTCL